MNTIYYIEDDENIAGIVKEYLEQRIGQVSLFATISSAKEALQRQVPELVLVDWNLPDGQGDGLCRWIRSHWPDLPIIFLTVRNDTADIITGFRHGADDYVTKPFELEILHSRISALLRRTGNTAGRYLSCDSITIDQNRMRVFDKGEEITVSQTEYQLLLLLMKHKGRTMTRERLLEQIWDSSGSYVNDNTLTVAMKRLREKLHQPACLKTIRSFGYRMEDTV